MTVNLLTTIGIREPHPLSLGGMFFTIFFSLMSFFALAAVISILSSVIVENESFFVGNTVIDKHSKYINH